MALAPVALYVHVPFCRSICPYCDFAVYAGSAASGPRSQIGGFVEALHVELDLRADVIGAGADPGVVGRRLSSVYLGGGTPSLLPAAEVGRLLNHIDRRLGIQDGAEITLEANPGPEDRGDLAGLRAAGVTRLSIGAQSLVDSELRELGRRHRREDVEATVRLARDAGFESVSIDLLYDIPGQTIESWVRTLDGVVQLGPDHVSTYALALELDGLPTPDHLQATGGALRWRRRAAVKQDEDRAAEMDDLADAVLEPAGWHRYEIANRARPGHESRHNLAYWHSEPWEAIGPGAHAFDGVATRRWNDAALLGYRTALLPRSGSPLLPPGDSETASRATAEAERLMLALRLSEGIDASAVTESSFRESLRWGLEEGLLERVGPRVRLTARGRLISNELFLRLLPSVTGNEPAPSPVEVAA
jgi:oxygen-independent coproporphyrinogen-3 oxidase